MLIDRVECDEEESKDYVGLVNQQLCMKKMFSTPKDSYTFHQARLVSRANLSAEAEKASMEVSRQLKRVE